MSPQGNKESLVVETGLIASDQTSPLIQGMFVSLFSAPSVQSVSKTFASGVTDTFNQPIGAAKNIIKKAVSKTASPAQGVLVKNLAKNAFTTPSSPVPQFLASYDANFIRFNSGYNAEVSLLIDDALKTALAGSFLQSIQVAIDYSTGLLTPYNSSGTNGSEIPVPIKIIKLHDVGTEGCRGWQLASGNYTYTRDAQAALCLI
jgi:hypothetical protein